MFKYPLVALVIANFASSCVNRDYGSDIARSGAPLRMTNETYYCQVEDRKFIEFVPRNSEVHFLRDSGSSYKEHHDGLDFKYTKTADEEQMQIYDRFEGGKYLGGWKRSLDSKTFTIRYSRFEEKPVLHGCKVGSVSDLSDRNR